MDASSERRFWRTARTLERLRPRGKSTGGKILPSVFFFTDPQRVSDPLAVVRRLPRGTGVIFRSFGRPGAEALAAALARVAKARGLVLLIGADVALAQKVRAAGAHLPERDLGRVQRVRALNPRWIVTVAAHSPMALARAKANGADAAFYSAVFPSGSASAGSPVGPVRLGLIAKGAGLPVFALGGVNARTAPRLIGTGVAGVAAVKALSNLD